MNIVKLTVGQLQSNTYIIKKDNKVLIIDPGSEYTKIRKQILEDEEVLAILLTHGHSDHIGAVNELVRDFGCDVYLDKDEFKLILDPSKSFYEESIETDFIKYSSTLELGPFNIQIHKTPGHTYGSVLIEIGDDLFTGDTLFNMTIGRMDFPTGSQLDMRESLNYIKTFTKDYKIHPGHGDDSTLFYEFRFNPYFK